MGPTSVLTNANASAGYEPDAEAPTLTQVVSPVSDRV